MSFPTVANGLQSIALLDFAMLPETLQRENYTSMWTLPNGGIVSEESPGLDERLLVLNGLGSFNATKNVQHTTLLVQGLSYTDAGIYRCSVQDNGNPGSPPTNGSIELQLSCKCMIQSLQYTSISLFVQLYYSDINCSKFKSDNIGQCFICGTKL